MTITRRSFLMSMVAAPLARFLPSASLNPMKPMGRFAPFVLPSDVAQQGLVFLRNNLIINRYAYSLPPIDLPMPQAGDTIIIKKPEKYR